MELLGDMVHVESRFVLFVDSVSVGAWFAPFGTVVRNRFGRTQWYS